MSILKAGCRLGSVCGFIGGVLGGIISDWLMRHVLAPEYRAQDADCAGDVAVNGYGVL